MYFRFLLYISCVFLLSNCQRLPVQKYSQSKQKLKYDVVGDSLRIEISNSLSCKIRIIASSLNEGIEEVIAKTFPVTISANSDTLISYWTDKTKEEIQLKFSAMLGDPNDPTHKKEMNLPFPSGYKFQIIQGYNGGYSHTSEYSKYALDFNLLEGDTICASADGYVVGVIKDYSKGGKSKKWRDYANYINALSG